MTIIQAIFLGAVQGIAEFLPISSSGHLAVAEYFLGHTDIPIMFDIMLHIATLGAVCIVFYKQIGRLLTVLGRFIIRKNTQEDSADLKLIGALLISTAVTGVIGIVLKDIVQAKNMLFIAVCFVITGIVLLLSAKIQPKKNVSVPSLLQAAIIGAALLTGVDREKAGEYSFLLSIPAILAAFIFELKSADTISGSIGAAALIAGMATAFIVGLFALTFLLTLIRKGKLGIFAYYLIPAGIALFSAVGIFQL